MLEQSYTGQAAGSGSQAATTAAQDKGDYWPLSKLRKCYTNYLFNKRAELDEQIDARRYYHGSQYTAEQIAILRKRRQPIMTFNRIGRKIDGTVGLIEKLRQDPKAFARTPKHEEGAELATAALRYVLDEQEWKAKSPHVANDGAVDGIGGIEIDLVQGDQGDPEIGLLLVDQSSFFYDPHSYQHDFSDARYMGTGRWLDDDIAKESFPKAPDGAFTGASELTSTTDREMRWFAIDGQQKRVRIIDIWYKHKGGWCYAIFTGSAILEEGKSPFKDEKGKDYCKYCMFSGNVDQEGDRYGLVRNMKSAQDGINAKQSKAQHILASNRLMITQGSVDDIEKTRQEWARPDGVVITNRPVNEGIKADDRSFDFAGWVKMLELNLMEIEKFGPNPELMGQTTSSGSSGRAISLLQQAGMAELGPYILAYRGWKLRVYRNVFNAIQQHWKAERWIRVTDDDGLAQYIQINGLQMDPNTGQPTLVNALGSLDVDIILDEAPDAVTIQAQSFETLQALGPAFIQENPDIAIELAPLDSATKKKWRDKQQAKAQQQQPQQQLMLANAQAEVENVQQDSQLKQAQAIKALADAHAAPIEALMSGQPGQMQPQEYEVPPELQNMQAMADIENTQAKTQAEIAKAHKTHQEAALAPAQMEMDMANAAADRAEQRRAGDADRKIAAKKATQKPQAQR